VVGAAMNVLLVAQGLCGIETSRCVDSASRNGNRHWLRHVPKNEGCSTAVGVSCIPSIMHVGILDSVPIFNIELNRSCAMKWGQCEQRRPLNIVQYAQSVLLIRVWGNI